MSYKLSDFNYELPQELIAQYPLKNRVQCRMMHLNRKDETIKDEYFYNILSYLNKDDVLVLNDTKVYPARLIAKRETGALVEIFLLNPLGNDNWEALTKNAKRVKIGETLTITNDFSAQLIEKKEAKKDEVPVYIVKLNYSGNIYDNLNKYASIPLPPYISREITEDDKDDYQTVFAHHTGSVAAPTAGLHFDNQILEKIKEKGVKIAYITLSVGLGTFMPVKTDNIENHSMHYESFSISDETANLINNKKGAIIAVGTTVLRCLEAVYQKHGKIIETTDKTNIFIYPPYKIKSIDKLITNFHLPKSTLIMLISAFAGKDYVFRAYEHAISEQYRFFSYGDCMFIE
ncbi:tRNA preQ1(34) S-adenosylmethionine ribosyltransferase-isomerase QueA [bacterium]|nr:tRNA preQ1(34) S-adenosylmethionine ribosyltransferase-isomerase QueA [bacterium]